MVLGKYEYAIINLDDLVFLPQVRKIKNSKLEELAESIATRGLINPLDVAKLSYEELLKHIKFLNQLWNRNVDINSFKPVDGFYYVIIAGHSRLEALKINAKKNHREDQTVVKIHKAKTSEEILAIQLDENIYAEPRLEERAIAIIETYRLGIINKKWKDKGEFIEQNKDKFSKRILSDALAFSDLPLEVQEYIFAGNIFYAVGVELGRLFSLIERYEKEFEQDETLLKRNVELHYATLLMRLQKVGSVKKSLAVLSSHRKSLCDYFKPKEEVQQELFDYWQDGPDRQGEAHRNQLLAEYKKISGALHGMPFEYFVRLYRLDSNLTGFDHSSDISKVRGLYMSGKKPDSKY
ncbi:MAG TPA: ParB/RepB/Spo0J family partition protein [Bacilli bacterium]|nr:ParB/RepB/Spo0J family partition protein [Bacilli bacterium]